MRGGSDPKRGTVTFVAVADGIEVDVVLLVIDEEQAEPGVKGVHWHDEEDADDVALLVGDGVGPKMRVDLKFRGNKVVNLTTGSGLSCRRSSFLLPIRSDTK